jgi:transposase
MGELRPTYQGHSQPVLETGAFLRQPIAMLESFATRIKQDYAAVRAALETARNNGPTEGQINRLKLLKRQMYSRANFDLLR